MKNLPEEKQKEIALVNNYMVKLVEFAEKQRTERANSGIIDKPVTPAPPSKMSDSGELEFRFPSPVQRAGETSMDS